MEDIEIKVVFGFTEKSAISIMNNLPNDRRIHLHLNDDLLSMVSYGDFNFGSSEKIDCISGRILYISGFISLRDMVKSSFCNISSGLPHPLRWNVYVDSLITK